MPAGPGRRPPRRAGSGLLVGEVGDPLGARAPAQVRTRLQRAQAAARRIDEDPVDWPAPPDVASASAVSATRSAPHSPQRASQRVSASRVALDRHQFALVAHQRRQVGGLGARRGAQIEHALARRRSQRPPRPHRPPRLGHQLARGPTAATRRRRTALRAPAPRGGRARHGSATLSSAASRSAAASRVLTRSADSAGSLIAASSFRVALRRRAAPTRAPPATTEPSA